MTDEGWTTMRFDEFAERINETVMPAESELDRYIGLEHLDTMDLTIRRWDEGRNLVGQKLVVRKGDIIIARRNWYLRRVAIAPFDALCSAHAMIVRPKKDAINHEFFPFFLLSDQFYEKALSISVGSLSPTINWSSLRKLEFDLPPFEAVDRLIDILRSWVSSRAKIIKSIHQLDGFKTRLNSECMCIMPTDYGKYSLPDGWEWKRLDDVSSVQGGRQRSPKYANGPNMVEYLRVANIGDGKISYDDVLSMNFSESDFESYRLKKDDLLLVEGHADKRMVGRCSIFEDDGDYCFQNTLIRVRVNADYLLPKYIEMVVNELRRRQILLGIVYGTSINHLGSTRLSRIKIPVPPLPFQKEVVAKSEIMSQLEQTLSNNLTLNSELGCLLIEEISQTR